MGVLGIGGLFFRARDTEALAAWYRDHLNVGPGCNASGADGESDGFSWIAQGGPVLFLPFQADTDYFPADKGYMLNFRVNNIDGLTDWLKSAGISVETRDEWNDPSTGRFARIHDPEGNPVELWEPPSS